MAVAFPMRLLHPWALLLFAAIVLLILWRRQALFNAWQRILSSDVFDYLGGSASQRHASIPLLMAAGVALALSSPALKQTDGSAYQQSQAWILVVDVSRSMTLNDTVPSRLAAARTALATLAEAAGARAVALMVYAGDAFLVSPPAFDRQLIDEQIALLEHGIVPMEGTNLARALSLASSVMAESDLVQSRVFVLSDSGGSGRAAEAAAQHLASEGHRVDILLYGLADGTTASTAQSAGVIDLSSAAAIARAGQGQLVEADALGQLDWDLLDLDRYNDPADLPELSGLHWHNQSHWLLLLLIPLWLWWWKEQRA